ncbi:MAG TPA: hypothetical protein VH374_05530 [Polyangia bacterium]|jgi:hypothetical protein|nr:hypothetical protein [Polyangia bacterium]
MRQLALAALLSVFDASGARAEGPRLADDRWPVQSTGRLGVDLGLSVGLPATWQTGLGTGVGGGITIGRAQSLFVWGVRASWSTATESSLAWTVTHQDIRLRAAAGLQRAAGRGTLGLRLGVGPTVAHETRTRNQGARAGLTGSDLQTSTFATLPAADLEAVVNVRVAGPWFLTVGGGPSLALADGSAHGGWTAQLGAGWWP